MLKQNIYEPKIEIIKEIACAIASTDNIDAVTNVVLELALSHTKAGNGSILLLNKKGELIIKAANGLDREVIPAVNIKIGENICGMVAKEKNPLLVKDIKTDERFKKRGSSKYKTTSFICCPILMHEKLLGVINVTDKIDGSVFTEDDFELIEILTSQIAISLEYARLKSELYMKALELDERNRMLIDYNRSRNEFIASISHEFRTPLNSITGALFYIKEKKVSEGEQKEFIDIISDETYKLIHLLDGLLNFSLLKEEPLLNKKALNFKDLIHETIASRIVKDILAEKNISINASCPDSLPGIVGDKICLIESIIHLIDGITKYTVAGDSIDMEAACKEAAVEVVLFIKGRAIPESDLPFIFDERSLWTDMEDTKNKLKFYLAKRTVEQHKGAIFVLNAQGGIVVRLEFPRSDKEFLDAKINELTNLFLSFTAEAMNLDKCTLMLSEESTGEMTIRGAIGFDRDIVKKTGFKNKDKIAGKALLCLPITVNEKVIGVLNLNGKLNGDIFTKKDLYFASVIAEHVSSIVKKIQQGNMDDNEFNMIARNLENLFNAVKRYKKRNGRSSDLVLKLMRHLKRSEDEIKSAVYASALYDLGMTQVNENILMKSGNLSDMERKIIKTHPFYGAGLIASMESDDNVGKIILHHHERYDGSGYPDGLKGDSIPFCSRVLAVVDTYTAMTSDRPYRKAFGKKNAVAQIKGGAGTQFDPLIVDAFTKVVRKNIGSFSSQMGKFSDFD